MFSICKALFHICDLDISSVPTNFGLGFYIDTIFLLEFASNFNGVKFWGHILHLNFGLIYCASDFVTYTFCGIFLH